MPTSESSESSTRNVPFDVLREIFILCLPRYPLDRTRQPNVRMAPIVLCHICSSWRTAALTFPRLWSHLSCRLMVHEIEPNGDVAFLKNQIDFLRWWSNNQGSIPSFLNIDVEMAHQSFLERRYDIAPDDFVVGDSMDFILAYFMSAQHLQLDIHSAFFWNRLQGLQVSFPNLHTLVEYTTWVDQGHEQFGSAPKHSLSQLRRLYASRMRLPAMCISNNVIPSHWSALTHIALCNIKTSLSFWFFLIRALRYLQWGYFEIAETKGDYTKPDKRTLAHLTTLCIDISDNYRSLSLLFADLYLPALHMLSLSAFDSNGWIASRAVAEVSEILPRAPNIRTLTLGSGCLGLEYHVLDPMIRTEPVWSIASRLSHLQLVLESAGQNHISSVIQNVCLSDNGWVQIRRPDCPIRTVTIVNAQFSSDDNSAISCIVDDLAANAPDVTFRLASESVIEQAENAWRYWGAIF